MKHNTFTRLAALALSLVLALSLAACGKKNETPDPAPTPGPDPAPTTITAGRFSRAAAMSIPGTILSQEPSNTKPSSMEVRV